VVQASVRRSLAIKLLIRLDERFSDRMTHAITLIDRSIPVDSSPRMLKPLGFSPWITEEFY